MKVVHLTTIHRGTDARIFERECTALAAAGHDVVLLCRHDRIERVGRVTLKPLRLGGNRAARMSLGLIRSYRAARAEAADVYHLHDPELLVIAPFLARRGCVVFDAHEDLPAQITTKVWLPAFMRRPLALLMGRLLPLLLRPVEAVVAATPAIARTIANAPVSTVQNLPRGTERSSSSSFAERPRAVAYIGGLNRIRGAEQLVDALALLPSDSATSLRFAGTFEPAGLKGDLSTRPGWRRVRVEGWLDRGGLNVLLTGCRAGILTFLPAPNHLASQPNKLFEYMAASLPVIASDFPLWREIVEGNRCGLLVDPRDPRAIADAIELMVSDPAEAEEMGRRGRAAIERTYNWGTQERILLELYEGLSCASGS